ncbi:LmeA family phospholipid-binding protein [Georgenia ruanii]|uniref:DUF2993 domain-containing protein n=1 Tax=Georgenia ruanii TaxID=348442 RepID=A0A7J9UTQ8_9MICO|nr:DUF2993 domain-containing protein [Georgenia ruanii]MPV88011.1 DUF2993 domain-containing protein [Georgenia ruanii]
MRRLFAVLLTLVLLVAVAVAADRVAAGVAERAAATEIARQVDVAGTPDVTIAGFPFLTQLAARDLDDVRVRAEGVAAEGVELGDVDIRARGVGLAQPLTARTVRLTGTLRQPDLQRLVDQATGMSLTVDTGTDGVTLGTTVLGQPLELLAVPEVSDGTLTLRPAGVTLGDKAVDVGTVRALLGANLLDVGIPLGDLPLGMTLAEVTPRDDGVRVTLTGQGVALPA